MIKMIFCVGQINYDQFLDNMFKMAKEHPEALQGMKLPPFTDKVIKMMPADKKNAMIAQAINSNKAQMLPQAQMALGAIFGPCQLRDLEMTYDKDARDMITLMIELSYYDGDYMINNLMPQYYSEYTASEFLGADYVGSYALADVQRYMHLQDYAKKQLLIARSMSVNKSFLMQLLQRQAANSGIALQMNNIRIMIK